MTTPEPDGGARPSARQLAFEFSPQPRYGDDDFLLAPSNAALVRRAAELCEAYGRPVASWRQAREILKLKPRG